MAIFSDEMHITYGMYDRCWDVVHSLVEFQIDLPRGRLLRGKYQHQRLHWSRDRFRDDDVNSHGRRDHVPLRDDVKLATVVPASRYTAVCSLWFDTHKRLTRRIGEVLHDTAQTNLG